MMARWKTPVFAALALVVLSLPGTTTLPTAAAEGPIVIRYASMAPGASAYGKVLKAWNRSVKKETEGRVEIRFYSGGSQGDERDFLRKIRVGQLDAAGVTAVGLGMVVRPVLVLTAPGVITTYEQMRRVRSAMNERFDKMFQDAGFELLAWGDGGLHRLFSVRPFEKPDDLKSMRPWAWKDDPVYSEFINTIGANGVRVGAMEVYGGLQTRMIDFVPAAAMSAIAFQWYTKLNYVSKQNINVLIGGSIIQQSKFNELSPEDQRVLRETSLKSATLMDKIAMRDDAKAYQVLLERGTQEVDLSPHQAAWDAVANKTNERLVGRVFSKDLLATVKKHVAEH